MNLRTLNWHSVKAALIEHYSQPLKTIFKQFRSGLICFGIGLAVVLYTNAQMPPSAAQEALILLGLMLLATGFVIAMLAQIRILISRIFQFWRR